MRFLLVENTVGAAAGGMPRPLWCWAELGWGRGALAYAWRSADGGADGEPAVDVQDDAGDVAGGLGGEEGGGLGDVGGPADVPHRDLGGQLVPGGAVHRGEHRGLDQPGSDGVGGDAVPGAFQGEGAGEPDD